MEWILPYNLSQWQILGQFLRSNALCCSFLIIKEIVMYEFSKGMPMLHKISSGLQEFGVLDSIKKITALGTCIY